MESKATQKEPRLLAKAILAGVLADFLGTLLTSFLLLAALFAAAGRSQETVNRALGQPTGLAVLGLLGAFWTWFGGYLAGRVAARDEVRHGAATGVASLAVGLLIELIPAKTPAPFPAWYTVLTYLLVVPLSVLGGLSAARRRMRSGSEEPR